MRVETTFNMRIYFLILFLSLLPGKTHVFASPELPTNIQYSRQFLYDIAAAPASKVVPTNLPDWIPTRENVEVPSPRKRGKRGGVRNRLRKRGFRPSLPVITLSNVRSLHNKVDEIRALKRYCNYFRNSGMICLTETWLNPDITNENIAIDGFDIARLDRSYEHTSKRRGGGICVYVNKRWCTNFTVKHSICNKDVELLCVSFRPFYLPREFNQVHLFLVYVAPDADGNQATQHIQDIVGEMEALSPDSPKIILGDFNHCRLENSLPNYCQAIDKPTRGENILDRCYCSIQNAYKCIVRPPIGLSDHNVVHLLPKYRQKLKTQKPAKKIVQVWNNEATEKLQTCFQISDWDVFFEASDNLNGIADTINDYVVFCQNLHVQSKTVRIYPNNKPWITRQLRAIVKVAF